MGHKMNNPEDTFISLSCKIEIKSKSQRFWLSINKSDSTWTGGATAKADEIFGKGVRQGDWVSKSAPEHGISILNENEEVVFFLINLKTDAQKGDAGKGRAHVPGSFFDWEVT